MTLTYELQGKGYMLLLNGEPWMDQTDYIPPDFVRPTVNESAQAHIEFITEQQNAEREPSEIEVLRRGLAETKQQLAETQDALIELAGLVVGGAE